MLFNSLEFLIFAIVVFGIHFWVIPRDRIVARRFFLTVASYFFYMSWNPPFGLLLLFSTALDYFVGLRLQRSDGGMRRMWLCLSLLGNLGMLSFFKYGDFLSRAFYDLVGAPLGYSAPPVLDVLLPVGISFYTFQSLSYTIDIYRRQLEPTRSFLDFAFYVSFFPQLVAGPIVRAAHFLPQLANRFRIDAHDVEAGLWRIATGLFKKVVLADQLALYVDRVFSAGDWYAGGTVLLATYAFAFQIDFDFSGYSDIGLGRLFGFRIPDNFARPYGAENPQEFWRRWHISLSTWLRDYLYIPLGGGRRGRIRNHANLLITMLLGGLWHGASWNFVLWGAYHGLWLAAHRWVSVRRAPRLPRWTRQLLTFHGVCLGWLIFRCDNLAQMIALIRQLAIPSFEPSYDAVRALLVLGLVLILYLVGRVRAAVQAETRLPAWLQGVAYAGIAVSVYLFAPSTGRFIYFQF